MDFKQIEAFVSVVKYKSFSRAADASFLTQPTISAHINSLEKELGTPLIDRMGKESKPTHEGLLFYKYALDMLHMRDEAARTVSAKKDDISGILELQASSLPGQYVVPVLMARFREQHENVRFYLEQSDSKQASLNISRHKGELGFTGYLRTNELVCDFLCRDKCVVITPKLPKYLSLLEQNRPLTLSDLEDEAFIWREEGSATRKTFEEQCYEKGIHIHTLATMNSIGAIKTAVTQGMGISVLSEMAIRQTDGKASFLAFTLEGDGLEREFYMIHKKNVTLSPVAAEFKRFTLDYFKNKNK